MIRNMIANFALLTAFLFIFHHLYYSYLKSAYRLLPPKIIIGLLHGICGCLLLLFSFQINEDTYIDFRHLVIMSAAYFGGLPASLIAAFIIVLVRCTIFGEFTTVTLIAMLTLTINGLGSGWIMRRAIGYWRKWQASLLLVSSMVAFMAFLKNSDPKYVILYIALLVSGGVFTASLISFFSTHHRLSQDLTNSEKRYRTLHALQEAIFHSLTGTTITVIDRGGHITHINKAAERMLGYDSGELIGQSPLLLHDPAEIRRFMEERAAGRGESADPSFYLTNFVLNTAAEGNECSYIRKDGSRLTVLLNVSELLLEGEVIGHVILATDISERKEMEQRLQRLSLLDGLTGIANRRFFDEKLTQVWRGAGATDHQEVSLIMLDIDDFKPYNDLYGHPAGDACLVRVTDIVNNTLDRPEYTFARYGGEEFAVILPNTRAGQAIDIAEELRSAVESAGILHIGTNNGIVTISVGVSTCTPSLCRSPEQLVLLADQALYDSKTNGRNKVSHYLAQHK